ncbi:MAG: hypothetical protein KBD01_15990 [Acidobacteria bacterium]|nr:hypothetical protein [Acidobacteriota bacterium]
MPETRCSRCGAPVRDNEPDVLARCAWCGALLGAGNWSGRTLFARPRLDERAARQAVARELDQVGRPWLPGPATVMYFPFSVTGEARRPYRPLAQLPPTLARGWKPSGADLVASPPSGGGGAAEQGGDGVPEQVARVAATIPEPREGPVILYPFFRVTLSQAGEESAAWCDGVDGRVMLPGDLQELHPVADRSRLGAWPALAMAGGLGAGLVFPFPVAVAITAAGGALLWWRSSRR